MPLFLIERGGEMMGGYPQIIQFRIFMGFSIDLWDFHGISIGFSGGTPMTMESSRPCPSTQLRVAPARVGSRSS